MAVCALASPARAALAHKVQTSDPAAARAILAAGGRLIADYGGYQLFAAAQTNGLQVRDDYNCLLLNAALLDTTQPETQALRQPAGRFAGKRLHLLQFAGPVQPAWRKALLETGAQIVNYIPHNAYLVYGDAAALARVQSLGALSFVQWDGPFLDQYKTHPAARAARTNLFAVQLVADAPVNAATIALLAPVERPRRVLQFINVVARLAPADLDCVAARPDVVSIQPWHPARKQDERQDQIVAGNLSGDVPLGPGYLAWLAGKGFTQAQFDASGFVVDVADSGIDNGTTSPNHFGLYSGGITNSASRVAYARLVGTPNSGSTLEGCDGHGTINAHIAGGYDNGTAFPFLDDAGYHYGLGVCPFVQLGSSVVFDPDQWTSPNFAQLESQAYESGARISNNSWGYPDSDGVYGVASQEYDALVRDAQTNGFSSPTPDRQEMVIVFAAGDSGPENGTVLEPGTAKNVFDVGGADNVQLFGGADGCGVGDDQAQSANEIPSFSSRGPCADGRHKPDLVAPSTHVSGGVVQAPDPGPFGAADPCYDGESVCGGLDTNIFYPADQQFYTASSGTSHSTPCVAGGCALLRQYLVNNSFLPPSPAMTKAYLMNCARYLTGATANDTLWSDAQGMGELDLGAAFDGTPRLLRDQLAGDTFTASGQTRTFTGSVADTNLPFRVTLAWTDAPGSTTAAAYNNDLDLTVNIGGQLYLGNVFTNQWSVPGGAADEADNVESVFLPAGVAGPFTVTIAAANINSVGVPNATNGLTQDFALVMDNAAGAGPPLIAPAGAALLVENCLPTNGVIDPGETVTVDFKLQNIGAVATTNLIATLQAGGGIDSPSGPAVYGALPAGGAPVAQPLTFAAAGSCGGTITATIQLQDGSVSLGSLQFTFPLGQLVPAAAFTQNFDGVTPPALPTGWTTAVSDGQAGWITTNGVADTPPDSAFAPATTNAGIAELLSPAIPIATSSAQLTFRNYYDLEVNPFAPGEALDGGVLEIQLGANAFADLMAAGGSFVSNGYNMTIASSNADDNPLPDRPCWGGNSGGYVTTVANLPAAAAGENIQLKWRLATDSGNAYGSVGWWIDSISITDGGSYMCCDGTLAPLLTLPHIQGTNFFFSFQSASNQTYVVEYNNTLSGGAWTPVQMLSGDGTVMTITNGLLSSPAFYRIRTP